ncbi:hypothetical protein D3C80_908390 [compost metagenome]
MPVAADPARAARDVHQIIAGILLVQQHVAQQAGAGVTALQQIVAQYQVRRAGAFQAVGEHVHVVNAFADKRAFAKQILIDVRGHQRIGVITRRAAAQGGITALAVAGDFFGHAWLQDGITFNHPLLARIVLRLIERVRHRGDQLMGAFARQDGIAVERNDIFDVFQHLQPIANLRAEGVTSVAQPVVQRIQFAAFSFQPHPYSLFFIPFAVAVKQEKVAGPFAGIASVQCFHLPAGVIQQGCVVRMPLLGRIVEVGEQGKVQMFHRVAQITNLKRIDQFIDAAFAVD